MEEKENRASLRLEEWGGQRFVYEEDGESCFYYDKECINKKEKKQIKRWNPPKRKEKA